MTQAETAGSTKAIIRDNPVRSLAKAVLLLEALADEREATPRRLSELLREPRTTVYRLLTGLQALNMVEAGSRPGTYRLGWRLFARFVGPGEEEVAPPPHAPVPAE